MVLGVGEVLSQELRAAVHSGHLSVVVVMGTLLPCSFSTHSCQKMPPQLQGQMEPLAILRSTWPAWNGSLDNPEYVGVSAGAGTLARAISFYTDELSGSWGRKYQCAQLAASQWVQAPRDLTLQRVGAGDPGA